MAAIMKILRGGTKEIMMKIRVETSIDESNKLIFQKTWLEEGLFNKTEIISEKVINLQEQGIKEALIKLGWKPPV